MFSLFIDCLKNIRMKRKLHVSHRNTLPRYTEVMRKEDIINDIEIKQKGEIVIRDFR